MLADQELKVESMRPDDAYDGYEDSSEPRPADISTVEGYDDFDDSNFDDSSEEGVVSIEEDDIDPDDRNGE